MRGFRAHNQTVYLDSIRYIPRNSVENRDRRKLWADSFRNSPATIKNKLNQRIPALRTHASNIIAGRRVEAGGSHRTEGCHGVDALSSHVAGFDTGRNFGDCLAHCVMNNVRDMFAMAGGSGRMKFTQKRQALERLLGRAKFLEWDTDVVTDSDDEGADLSDIDVNGESEGDEADASGCSKK